MLHSVVPQYTSSASAFAWIKELLEQGGHEIISSDEPAGRIDTKHALFHVIEQDAAPNFAGLHSTFADALKKNKNFAMLAPNLGAAAANSIAELRFPLSAARHHRYDVLTTKVILATTEATIENAITEMTKANKMLQAFGRLQQLQAQFWLSTILCAASMIEDIAHAPEPLKNSTFVMFATLLICQFIGWIAGRRRFEAVRHGVAKIQF